MPLLDNLGGSCNYSEAAKNILSSIPTNEQGGKVSDKLSLTIEEAKSFFIYLALDALRPSDAADTVLCAWALLDGYQKLGKLTNRRRHYLEEYEKYVPVPSDKAAFSAAPKNTQKSRVNARHNAETAAYKVINEYFKKISNITEYVEKASKSRIKPDIDPLIADCIDYPKPHYIGGGKASQTPISPPDTLSIEDAPENMECETAEVSVPKQEPRKRRRIIIRLLAALGVIVVTVVIIIASQKKAQTGESGGGNPPVITTNWNYSGIEDLVLGYGLLSEIRDSDWNVETDYQGKLKSYAESGEAWAQFHLGAAYMLMCDYEQARDWISRAAEQDHTSAQAVLSVMHMNGLGVEKNFKTAFKWALLSAQQDNPLGQILVGDMYRLGYGQNINFDESAYWYERALTHGHYALVEYHLADYYAEGKGVFQDFGRAISLYEQSYNDGWRDAASALARLYEDGDDGIRDLKAAAEWYQVLGDEYNLERCLNLLYEEYELNPFHSTTNDSASAQIVP